MSATARLEDPGADILRRERWADLLEAIAVRQDRDAFAELFQYFAPRVKGYLMRLGLDAAQADEIAQEVLVTVWRKAALFDRTQAAASTWIFRIARNRRIDAARRASKPELTPEDFAPEPERPADDSLIASDDENAVRGALAALPPQQRELLLLAFYEGLSHSEIAERLGLPLGTVKSRIRLAFAKMRDRLGAEGEPN